MFTLGRHSAAILRPLGFAVAGTTVAVAVWAVGALDAVNRASGDVLLRLTHRDAEPGPVAAVVIDDRAIAMGGPLPWSRAQLGCLVDAVRRAGGSAVAMDLLLAEQGEAEGDQALAEALDRGPSILAAALSGDETWIVPASRFGTAAHAAHVHVEVDADGVARTIIATKQADDLSLPALSLAAARLLRSDLIVSPGASLRPDFRPAPSRIPAISAADLERPEASTTLSGRLVFIGITATGAGDRLIVPTEARPAPSAGVLVHASATASLLRNGLVRPAPFGWIVLVAWLAGLATQVARDRTGSFRLVHLAVVLAVIGSASVLILQVRHVMLAPAPLAMAPVVAVLVREAVESRLAHRASGHLVAALLRHHGIQDHGPIPASAAGRLVALQDLQTAVLREDRARRALLIGMADGVVMWTQDRQVVIANPAAEQLWGDAPIVEDLEKDRSPPDLVRERVVPRHGREVSVRIVDLDGGGLALLRDVTAERELERRRRDMQRMVSHELKTPLASIAGLGETVERYDLSRSELQRVAGLIRSESSRLGTMVETFLDLERLSSGGWEPASGPCDLTELVARRLAVLDEAARTKSQRIERHLGGRTPVLADSTLMERVIDNLVGNALKYSPDGATVHVSVENQETDVVLRVVDHGFGIPEDAVPRLFERFYRVPGSRGDGSGLGLAVAREVVSWHGGCITVDTTLGQGTAFTVRLPAEN